ncbi:PP2C phosphatase [Cryptosporidium bovis]|uniref:PP2C phosphatase n=1 Tax=Cryptosporidium bovis TaxID=310047 RepID=UPI003519F36D|nr:PP2C phosphatase [Cryptosporidium bovis]
MDSPSVKMKAPMSTILGKPGFIPGYHQPFKSGPGGFFPNKNQQIFIPASGENTCFNGDLSAGMMSASGPSMSTPLNVFQNIGGIRAQPNNYMNIGKSLTSSMNPQMRPQRFSSYSHTFNPNVGSTFNNEFEYNTMINHINYHVNNPGKIMQLNRSIPQHKVPYPVQPQVIVPHFVYQQGQSKAIRQPVQNHVGVGQNTFIGYTGENVMGTNIGPGNYNNLRNTQINQWKNQVIDQNSVRLNTFGNAQPQIMSMNNEFMKNEESKLGGSKFNITNTSSLDIGNKGLNSIGNLEVQEQKMEPITGGVTIKGFKPTVVTENQDKSLIIELGPKVSAYGVFDGHGPHGDVIANFVSEKFSLAIMQLFASVLGGSNINEVFPTRQQIKNFFIVLFNNMDLQLSELKYGISLWSGCTAALCVKISDEVHIAWVGDSRVVVFKFSRRLSDIPGDSDQDSTVSWWTTSDHVPNRPDELSRITDCGASITVYSTPWLNKSTTRIREHGIAMSRSFGDKAGSQFGVISKPDMASIKLSSDNRGDIDERWAIVVASDGVWDSLSEEEVGNKLMEELIWKDNNGPGFKSKYRPTKDEVASLANSIASEAWKFRASVENYSDDTTIVISII